MSAGAAHSELEMLRDLLAPENLPAPAGAPELRSTHSSRVILADSDVFKLKRARDLGFLDYRGLSVRWHFCHEELRLNRRLAPDVYLGVVPVFRDARGYSMTRGGHVVDYAVHMRRLDESHSALTMHREGRLETDHLERLAVKLAHFESEALVVSESSAAFLESLHENFEQTRWQRGQLLSDDRWERIRTRQLEVASDTRDLRASRATKDGHGDLRLEHVYFESNEPIIIDCIEFLARFRHADPALDVAFLARDRHREGQPERAEWFLNRYAFASNDLDLYPLMALYASYRAFVRGKVAGFVVADEAAPPEIHERKAREAREYFELAERLLSPPSPRPRLIAVGGMIASGKTTLSAELAKRMPAVHLAADAVRKFLVGVPQEQPAPDHAYDAAMNTRVREELMRR
ncbi:MAG: zeta toxin family protein, partial [Salinibacterium sp.]|nr:zeta toxin family protein [Salinibacterium sp.]